MIIIKKQKVEIILLLLINCLMINGQNNTHNIKPDLLKTVNSDLWSLCNRELEVNDSTIYLNAMPGEGLLIYNEQNFSNIVIEAEIKGKNIRGRSFVGIAFNILSDSVYDAVYFRPFNFKNKERNNHSIQYISHPKYTWHFLRKNDPNKYESNISGLIPDPQDWFGIKITVEHPIVKVFVNDSKEPSLVVNQLSDRIDGKIGFWVGNNSDGYFRNLNIVRQ